MPKTWTGFKHTLCQALLAFSATTMAVRGATFNARSGLLTKLLLPRGPNVRAASVTGEQCFWGEALASVEGFPGEEEAYARMMTDNRKQHLLPRRDPFSAARNSAIWNAALFSSRELPQSALREEQRREQEGPQDRIQQTKTDERAHLRLASTTSSHPPPISCPSRANSSFVDEQDACPKLQAHRNKDELLSLPADEGVLLFPAEFAEIASDLTSLSSAAASPRSTGAGGVSLAGSTGATGRSTGAAPTKRSNFISRALANIGVPGFSRFGTSGDPSEEEYDFWGRRLADLPPAEPYAGDDFWNFSAKGVIEKQNRRGGARTCSYSDLDSPS